MFNVLILFFLFVRNLISSKFVVFILFVLHYLVNEEILNLVLEITKTHLLKVKMKHFCLGHLTGAAAGVVKTSYYVVIFNILLTHTMEEFR